MSEVFFAGDTHFGHAKISLFEPESRPFSSIEEHDEAIVDRWNSVIGKRDLVWHLGDVAMNSVDSLKHVARLNGTKKLVMGNHDKYHATDDLEYFQDLFGAVKYKGCVLTHIPIHYSEFYRFKLNIHGHLHSRSFAAPYVCVSIEQNDLKPVAWEDIREKYKEQLSG